MFSKCQNIFLACTIICLLSVFSSHSTPVLITVLIKYSSLGVSLDVCEGERG